MLNDSLRLVRILICRYLVSVKDTYSHSTASFTKFLYIIEPILGNTVHFADFVGKTVSHFVNCDNNDRQEHV